MQFFGSFYLALYMLFIAPVIFAGGRTSSGGGDYYTWEQNPYFLEDQAAPTPVSYCIEFNKDGFTLSNQAVIEIVADVIKDWQRTLSYFSFNTVDVNAPINYDRSGSERLAPRMMRMSTEFKYFASCSEQTDLTIYIGSNAAVIAHERQRYGALAPSGSKLLLDTKNSWEEYGKSFRAKGLIWLAPDLGDNIFAHVKWSESSVYNAMLHEFGHVFGFGHDDSSIMAEGMPMRSARGDGDTFRLTSLPIGLSQGIFAAQANLKINAELCGQYVGDSQKDYALLFKNETDLCIKRTGESYTLSSASGTQFDFKIESKSDKFDYKHAIKGYFDVSHDFTTFSTQAIAYGFQFAVLAYLPHPRFSRISGQLRLGDQEKQLRVFPANNGGFIFEVVHNNRILDFEFINKSYALDATATGTRPLPLLEKAFP